MLGVVVVWAFEEQDIVRPKAENGRVPRILRKPSPSGRWGSGSEADRVGSGQFAKSLEWWTKEFVLGEKFLWTGEWRNQIRWQCLGRMVGMCIDWDKLSYAVVTTLNLRGCYNNKAGVLLTFHVHCGLTGDVASNLLFPSSDCHKSCWWLWQRERAIKCSGPEVADVTFHNSLVKTSHRAT